MSDLIERAKEALEGATPGPWRPAKSYRALVSDSPSGYDDAESVDAYGGHMVCESVKEHNRPLIAMSPDLARALIAAGELAEVLGDLLDNRGDCYIPNRIATRLDWDEDAHDALAAFRAIVEGKA